MSHQCPGEANLRVRVERTGYLNGSSSYELGEVVLGKRQGLIAGDRAEMVRTARPHKTTIQHSSYDHAGVGLSIRDGVVFATGDFGRH